MNMQVVRPALIVAALLTSSTASVAALSAACQSRYDAVAAKIAAAKETGNSEEQASLQKSLGVASQCTDDKLRAAHAKSVKSQEATVKKREAELAKAQAAGSAGKVKTQQQKLSAAQAKLDQLKGEDPLAVK